MNSLKDISLLLCFLLCLLLDVGPTQAIEIRTAAQESAPKYFFDESQLIAGICVDIIKAIERTDPEIKFTGYNQFLPFSRLQKRLEDGELDAFLGFKKTPARLAKYQFVDIPLYQLDYKIAVHSRDTHDHIRLENIAALSPEVRILTVKGTAAASFLKSKNLGFLVDDSARSPTNMIKMLTHGRGRFVFYHDLSLYFVIDRMAVSKDVRVLPDSYARYSHYLAFSRQVSPKIVDKVTNALRKLRESGDLDRIAAQYKSSYTHQARIGAE